MTKHLVVVANGNNISELDDKSIDLVVTSPPYPMIEMWDEMFSQQDTAIKRCLDKGDGQGAFLKMHDLLNSVWRECDRVLKDNGFICINIGDATRTINGDFKLYSNHSKIIACFEELGYSVLPDIHWRKQSNAPNKFMGSGMYPAGAYVTYEHEYILVFRKGNKRNFEGEAKKARKESAYFWEERNIWFSDLWDVKGARQAIASSQPVRDRNASFPLEVPYRLINMYSVKGDTVLDPFLGLGTTSVACMISNRNSVGVEIDRETALLALKRMNVSVDDVNRYVETRVRNHLDFIKGLPKEKKEKCYQNEAHGFLVKTKQEIAIRIELLKSAKRVGNTYVCEYGYLGRMEH